jgi:hypothetical protein
MSLRLLGWHSNDEAADSSGKPWDSFVKATSRRMGMEGKGAR